LGTKTLEDGIRRDPGDRRDHEPLKETLRVASRSESGRGEAFGDVVRGAISPRGAGSASFHLGRGERVHVAEQLRSARRDEGGAQDSDQERRNPAACPGPMVPGRAKWWNRPGRGPPADCPAEPFVLRGIKGRNALSDTAAKRFRARCPGGGRSDWIALERELL